MPRSAPATPRAPREYRDPKLSRTDPMVVEHLKIPKSVLTILTFEGHRRQRSRTFIEREILEKAAKSLAVKHAEEAEAAKKSNPAGRGGKKAS